MTGDLKRCMGLIEEVVASSGKHRGKIQVCFRLKVGLVWIKVSD